MSKPYKFLKQKDFTFKGISDFVAECNDLIDILGIDFVYKVGTIHLKMSLEDFEHFRECLLNKRIYNDCYLKYNIIEGIVYISLDYSYYKTLCAYIVWISNYVDEVSSENYPERYVVYIETNEFAISKFMLKTDLIHIPKFVYPVSSELLSCGFIDSWKKLALSKEVFIQEIYKAFEEQFLILETNLYFE